LDIKKHVVLIGFSSLCDSLFIKLGETQKKHFKNFQKNLKNR